MSVVDDPAKRRALTDPVVRRAILDLLERAGGEHSDDNIGLMLRQLGHRVPSHEIVEHLEWLDVAKLVVAETLEHYTVARISRRGTDVARGEMVADGVSRFKTGD